MSSSGQRSSSKCSFFMDTVGRCFMCLNELRFSDTFVLNSRPSTMSFKLLSRHLKVDFGNVFCGGVPTRRSGEEEVAVPLCLHCNHLSEKFLQEYEQLEMMKMRVDSRVWELEEVMRAANVKSENYFRCVSAFRKRTHQAGAADVIQTTEKFRKEILAKCQLVKTFPRVSLKRVSLQKQKDERDVKLFKLEDTTQPIPAAEYQISQTKTTSFNTHHNTLGTDNKDETNTVRKVPKIPIKCPEVRVVLERLVLPGDNKKRTQIISRKKVRFSLPILPIPNEMKSTPDLTPKSSQVSRFQDKHQLPVPNRRSSLSSSKIEDERSFKTNKSLNIELCRLNSPGCSVECHNRSPAPPTVQELLQSWNCGKTYWKCEFCPGIFCDAEALLQHAHFCHKDDDDDMFTLVEP